MGKSTNYGYKKENPEKYAKACEEIKMLCPVCQHTLMIPVYIQYKVCSWCGCKTLNNTKARFNYMLRKKMKENENNK